MAHHLFQRFCRNLPTIYYPVFTKMTYITYQTPFMFRLLLCLLFLPALVVAQTFSKPELRAFYMQATQKAEAVEQVIHRLSALPRHSPTEQGYLGICHGLKAQHVESMWLKLRQVQKSKSLLNSAIRRDPLDPELRFLRFSIEHFIPSFLLMSGDINEDLEVIFRNPGFIDDNPKLKKLVVEFILWTNRANANQINQLQSALAELKKQGF